MMLVRKVNVASLSVHPSQIEKKKTKEEKRERRRQKITRKAQTNRQATHIMSDAQQQLSEYESQPVSYTHLTLPTKA